MQFLLVLAPDDVLYVDRNGKDGRGDLSAASSQIDPKQPVTVGVFAAASAQFTASKQTVDLAASSRFLPTQSFRTERLGENLFQAFAIDDDLFRRIRAIGRKVHVVPYAVAVRAMIMNEKPTGVTGLRRRTAVTRGTATSIPVDNSSERIAIDQIGADLLFTAFNGNKIVASRRVRGDALVELQRTSASAGLGSPKLFCNSNDLNSEFQIAGYQSTFLAAGRPVIGWQGLEQALPLQFLDAQDVAAQQGELHRKRAITVVAASVALFLVSAIGWAVIYRSQTSAESEGQTVQLALNKATSDVATLYQEHFPALEKRSSVRLHDELAELLLILPPQVVLLSLSKTTTEITAKIDRRADAAPFTREDLLSALGTSPLFAKATVHEDFDGTVIHYQLTLPVEEPKPQPTN